MRDRRQAEKHPLPLFSRVLYDNVRFALHGLHDTQSSRWSLSWALYTELTTAVLLFSIASGVVLIWPRRGERAFGLGAGALGLAAVSLMAVAIW